MTHAINHQQTIDDALQELEVRGVSSLTSITLESPLPPAADQQVGQRIPQGSDDPSSNSANGIFHRGEIG